MNPIDLCAPGVADLNPYVPGKPISEIERELGLTDIVKLASNENPLGPAPAARQAVAELTASLSRYPDGGAHDLRQALAQRHGVSPEQITFGNGSNDVLDLVARVFLNPGRESLFAQYAFAVYPISSQAVGARLVVVPARDFVHDLDAMRSSVTDRTAVVWVANPNNPTGTWLREGPLREFVASLPERVIVVIDEAYFEYVTEPEYPDCSRWLPDFPNLIVTRTFSKAYALAGLRIGYGLSSPEIADLLNRVRQPFNVNAAAQVAALAALDDAEHLRHAVALNTAGREQLTTGCRALGLHAIPSVGNFVTVDLGQPAAGVDRALLRAGVIARPVANYGLPDHLRISVGLEGENARCLTALKQVLGR